MKEKTETRVQLEELSRRFCRNAAAAESGEDKEGSFLSLEMSAK